MVFMGFPLHINATIGTAYAGRSEKKLFRPVMHKFIGRVGESWIVPAGALAAAQTRSSEEY